MLCTATLHARRQGREVLNVEIGHQIANVYAGLKGTNPAPWYIPLTSMIEALKSRAIGIAIF
jgi:hypothetical protein